MKGCGNHLKFAILSSRSGMKAKLAFTTSKEINYNADERKLHAPYDLLAGQ